MFGTTSTFLTEQQLQHFTCASISALPQVCYSDRHPDVQFKATISTQHTNTEGFSTTKRNKVLRWTQLLWEMRSSGALRSERRYHYTLRNAPEERISHLLRRGSLKPPNTTSLLYCSDLPQHYRAKGLRYSKRPAGEPTEAWTWSKWYLTIHWPPQMKHSRSALHRPTGSYCESK